MIDEYHLDGIDYSLFYDLAVFVLVLCAGMVLFSFWLRSQKRTRLFRAATWAIFTGVLCLGSFCIVSSVRTQQFLWFNYFAKTANSYAHVLMEFDNWKIHAGQEQFFSDWSPSAASVWTETLTAPAVPAAPPETLFADKKLATPQGLSVSLGYKTLSPDYTLPQLRRNQWGIAALTGKSVPIENSHQDKNAKQAVAVWDSVPGASIYRLQWKEDKSGTNWLDVYIGSVPSAVLIVPENVTLLFRVRAEDGTPEDNPIYCRLYDICDVPVTANPHIGYVYSMRISNNNQLHFVVSSTSDANHNQYIDITEKPSSIGEPYDFTPNLMYAFQHRKSTIAAAPITDEWGSWHSVFIPLWTPDDEFDGVFGIDFHAEALRANILRGKIYPYCFCLAVIVLFFGGTVFVTRLQQNVERQAQLAETLQFTVLELTEAEQVAENASRVKTQFLANMSHELRTPLNAVIGLTGIIKRQLAAENNTRFDKSFKQIQSSSNDLLSIINDILEYAMMDGKEFKLELVPINLPQLIHEVVHVMESRIEHKPLTLTVTKIGDIPEFILSDPPRIRQVLVNLIGNAIKFTEKGTVHIEYGVDEASLIIPKSNADKDTAKKVIYFSISDTGIGIAPDDIDLIFKPFSQADASLTRRYGGTGIGLSVSKNVAEMLGGRIDVTSTLGVGSTFTFIFSAWIGKSETILKNVDVSKEQDEEVIPTLPDNADADTAEKEQSRILADRRVLVVEDGKVNQIVIAAQLKEAGAEVTVADNGQIGIDKINEAEVAGRPFDIVLMDLQMPVLDGYEATAQLRKQGYKRPIIAVTAHVLAGDREKTLEAGCDEYIPKPVNNKMLMTVIQSFLDKAPRQEN